MPPGDGRRLEMTEQQFQDGLVQMIRMYGWLVHFVPDKLYRRSFPSKAQRESGQFRGHWEIDLGDRGYPDLTIVTATGIYYRELKVGRNTLTDKQIIWRDRILAAGGNWAEWRDRDYDDILEHMKRGVIRG